jgi:hypothetical protein
MVSPLESSARKPLSTTLESTNLGTDPTCPFFMNGNLCVLRVEEAKAEGISLNYKSLFVCCHKNHHDCPYFGLDHIIESVTIQRSSLYSQ